MPEELFLEDRSWLIRQPGMAPWPDGCVRLAQRLESGIREASASIDPTCEAEMPHLRMKLWTCWRHHWRGFANQSLPDGIAGETVWRSITAGQGARGHLGSNPLSDLVLIDLAIQANPLARQRFEECHGHQIERELARCGHDPGDIGVVVSDILGTPEQPGKASRYRGHSGFSAWLTTVTRRWAFDRQRGKSRRERREQVHSGGKSQMADSAFDEVAERDCRSEIVGVLAAALDSLDKSDRFAVRSHYFDGWTQKRVAEVLRLTPGSMTNSFRRAKKHLLQFFGDRITEKPGLTDCLEHLGLDVEKILPPVDEDHS